MSRPQYFEVSTNSPVEMGDTMGEYYFDSEMEDYGGRETTASLDRIRRIYWGHLDAIRGESPALLHATRGIYIDFVANGKLNAHANSRTPYDLIGIHTGTIHNIGMFFDVIFSHPRVFEGWGDSEKEVGDFETLAGIRWSEDMSAVLKNLARLGISRERAPRCPERRQLAGRVMSMALDFIFFHEMGHILYGHTDYLRMRGQGGKLAEFEAHSTLDPEFRQAIELHADSYAVWQITVPFLGSTEGAVPDKDDDVFLELVLFAIASVFYLLCPDRYYLEDCVKWPHPHPGVRLQYSIGFVARYVKMHLGWPEAKLEKLKARWVTALLHLEDVERVLGVPSAVWSAYESDRQKVVDRMTTLTHRLVNDVYPAMPTRVPLRKL